MWHRHWVSRRVSLGTELPLGARIWAFAVGNVSYWEREERKKCCHFAYISSFCFKRLFCPHAVILFMKTKIRKKKQFFSRSNLTSSQQMQINSCTIYLLNWLNLLKFPYTQDERNIKKCQSFKDSSLAFQLQVCFRAHRFYLNSCLQSFRSHGH